MTDTANVTGVWLRRAGKHAVVSVEIDDTWIDIIREPLDACFSHIANAGSLRKAAEDAAERNDYAEWLANDCAIPEAEDGMPA